MKRRNSAADLKSRFALSLRECKWFSPGLKLGAAVSAGADSVALLTLLAELRSSLGFVVSAVHFNHQLRGKASDADEKFVTALAEKFGLTLHIGRADVAAKARREKANLEDAARRARYDYFDRLAEQGIVDCVATAHTMDDQAETVLAHILRGTGIPGLSGIQPVAEAIRRPLLTFRRDDLRKYLRTKRQPWREDHTNRDTNRSRARMRKKLLPLLVREFNPAAVEHLAALATRAAEQSAFVSRLAAHLHEKLVSRDHARARIEISALLDPLGIAQQDSASALRNALIEKIVSHSKTNHGQLSSQHIEAIVRLAFSGETGKRLQLPGGLDVLRERAALVFVPRSEDESREPSGSNA